jgi:hypothetical protein
MYFPNSSLWLSIAKRRKKHHHIKKNFRQFTGRSPFDAAVNFRVNSGICLFPGVFPARRHIVFRRRFFCPILLLFFHIAYCLFIRLQCTGPADTQRRGKPCLRAGSRCISGLCHGHHLSAFGKALRRGDIDSDSGRSSFLITSDTAQATPPLTANPLPAAVPFPKPLSSGSFANNPDLLACREKHAGQ